MENKNTSLFTVYSQRLAGYLMQRGFVLVRLVNNQSNNFNEFIFVNTPAIKECIEKWNINKRKRNG